MAKTDKETKLKSKKFICANLFTNAQFRIEETEKPKEVIKGFVSSSEKFEFDSNSFFKRSSFLIRKKGKSLFSACIIFVLFLAPFFVSLFYLARLIEKNVMGQYNFMSSIGVGFGEPGHDFATEWWNYVKGYKMPTVAMLCLSIIIISMVTAGLFYVAKRTYFQENFTKKISTFFLGVKKYWWQFLITVSVVAIAVTSMVEISFYISSTKVHPGVYVGAAFVYLFGFLTTMFSMTLLSIYVSYNLKFGEAIKNTFVVIFNAPLPIILTTLLTALPLAVGAVHRIALGIIMAIMGVFGFVVFSMMWIALGHKVMWKCTLLDLMNTKKEEVAQRIINYTKQPKKKKKEKVAFVNPHKKGKNNG